MGMLLLQCNHIRNNCSCEHDLILQKQEVGITHLAALYELLLGCRVLIGGSSILGGGYSLSGGRGGLFRSILTKKQTTQICQSSIFERRLHVIRYRITIASVISPHLQFVDQSLFDGVLRGCVGGHAQTLCSLTQFLLLFLAVWVCSGALTSHTPRQSLTLHIQTQSR